MAAHSKRDMPPPARKSAASHIKFATPQKQPSDEAPSSDLVTSSSKRRRRNKKRSHRRNSFSSSNGTSVTRTTSNTSTSVQDHPPIVYKEVSPMPPTQVPPPASQEEQQVYDREPELFGKFDSSDVETDEPSVNATKRAETPPPTFTSNAFADDTSSNESDEPDEPALEVDDAAGSDAEAEQEEPSQSDSEDPGVDSNAEADDDQLAQQEEISASDNEDSAADLAVGADDDARAVEQEHTSASDTEDPADNSDTAGESDQAADQEEISPAEYEKSPDNSINKVRNDSAVEQEDVKMFDIHEDPPEDLGVEADNDEAAEKEGSAADLSHASPVAHIAIVSPPNKASNNEDNLQPERKIGKLKRKREPTKETQRTKKRARTKLSLTPESPTQSVQLSEAQAVQDSPSTKKRKSTRPNRSPSPDLLPETTKPVEPESVQQPRRTKKKGKAKVRLSPTPNPSYEEVETHDPEPVSTESKTTRNLKTRPAEPVQAECEPKAKSNVVSHKIAEVVVSVPRKATATRASGSGSGSKSTLQRKAPKQTSMLDSTQSAEPRKKTKQSEYTSAKGKDRAEDDTVYTSPRNQRNQRKRRQDGVNDDDKQEDESDGLATTIARRTRRTPEDSSESFADSGEDSAGSNPKSKSKQKKNAYNLMRSASKRDARRPVRASAGEGRSEAYTAGLTGKFTEDEREVLYAWRDQFCGEHDITQDKFNDIMTQTMRRKATDLWPYNHIVSREGFMAEYYDQLPDRNRRSMNRFREREFQNVTEKQWSPEEDEQLRRLVRKHGPKWVEIGLEMERTQDSVHQRWRNKAQLAGKIVEGDWPAEEAQQLQDAVARWLEKHEKESKRGDPKIPWSAIAKTIGGTRTARQCSNKWRNLTTRREEGKYIETPLSDRIAGTVTETRTPSKMHQRLTGHKSTVKPLPGKRKSFKSNERVLDSDDDEDVVEKEQSDSEVQVATDKRDPSPLVNQLTEDSDESEDSDVDGDQDEQNGQYDGVEIEESSGAKDVPAKSQVRSSFNRSQRRRPSLHSPPASPRNRLTTIAETSPPVAMPPDENLPFRRANPFVAKTPVNGFSLTQLHQGTQANTTAKRTNKRKSIGSALDESTSQDRMPSPELPLRQRPISSPLQMLGEQPEIADTISESEDEDHDLSLHTATSGHAEAIDDNSGTESSSESSSGSGKLDPELDGETASESEESEQEADKTEQRHKGFLSSLNSLNIGWPWSSQRSVQRSGLNKDEDD